MNASTRHWSVGLALCCAASAFALANAAAAAPASNGAKSCFYSRELQSWSEAGDNTVNLRVGINDFYQLKLIGACPDLKFAETVGLETHGGNFICSGLDVTLIVPREVTHTVPDRCMGTSLRKLTPAEVAALPPKQKP